MSTDTKNYRIVFLNLIESVTIPARGLQSKRWWLFVWGRYYF